MDVAAQQHRAERFRALTMTGADTDMGRLLRRFWHPVAISAKVPRGQAKAIRILGEDLTVYRGESGQPYLVDGHCAHRRTRLHSGWVQGEEIRCMFHGWKFNGAGQCTERPAEKDSRPPNVKIPGYPARDYGGLIFAYMGEGEAPAFDLPRKQQLEDPAWLLFPHAQTWPCNWFQCVENVVDAVHVSFVHQKGHAGTFGAGVTGEIPELEFHETASGVRQIATRGNRARVSDWNFPNNNHVLGPGSTPDAPWRHIAIWTVPNDDGHTTRFNVTCAPSTTPEADRALAEEMNSFADYNPTNHHNELFDEGRFPVEAIPLIAAQDYVSQVGQGVVTDRTKEILGRSDVGIVLLRRIFEREMEAVRVGKGMKEWRRLEEQTVQSGAAAE